MARYRRPTRCKICFNTGHNRRGCPHVKEAYSALLGFAREGVLDLDMPKFQSRWTYGSGLREILQDQNANPRIKEALGSLLQRGGMAALTEAVDHVRNDLKGRPRHNARRCSWCEQTGHTKRTCRKLSEDKEMLAQIVAFRHAYAEKFLKGRGLGVGSILKVLEETASTKLNNNAQAGDVLLVVDVEYSQTRVVELDFHKSHHNLRNYFRYDHINAVSMAGVSLRCVNSRTGQPGYVALNSLLKAVGCSYSNPAFEIASACGAVPTPASRLLPEYAERWASEANSVFKFWTSEPSSEGPEMEKFRRIEKEYNQAAVEHIRIVEGMMPSAAEQEL